MMPTDNELEAKFTLESEKTGVIDEPPFRILVLGDWSGDSDRNSPRPIEIDRDNFDEVIAKLGVRLDLDIADGSVLPLEFAELDDFHPDAIFRRVPMFADLRDVRRRLLNTDTFNEAAREVRSRFGQNESQETLASEPERRADDTSSGNLLDDILSGGGNAPRSTYDSDLGNLISDLVRPHLVSVDENEQRNLVAAVDGATSGLMRTIIHNRAFRELEAAWRGLYLLVRRAETASDLKIFLFDISKNELCETLKTAESLAGSTFHKAVFETSDDEPWSVLCGNFAFEPNIDDTAALIRISTIAAAANAPFISHMRPDILGVHSLAKHASPREWNLSADTDAGKLWAALRGEPNSAYLGMTIPRFLVRLPYGADTDPLETFSFEEFTDDFKHDDYVWSNACFAAALLLAQSYSSYGWEMGRALMQDIDGLPVHVHERDGETVFQSCAEVQLSENAAEQLIEYGLMPLVSYRDTDRVRLVRFQSITDPVTALKGRW
jgi:type VI secretion system protein ImpC